MVVEQELAEDVTVAVDADAVDAEPSESMVVEQDIVAVDAEDSEPPHPKRRRVRGKKADPIGLKEARARGLQYLVPRPLRLPLIMAAIIAAMMNIWPSTLDDPLDAVEMFSGVKSIVKGFQKPGMEAVGFDGDDDSRQDITKPFGMLDIMTETEDCE